MTDSNSVRGNLLDTAPPCPARTHGPYTLVRLLGEGSIAHIFEGVDPTSKRTVAIKLFRPEISQFPHFSARLRAHAVGPPRLEHANINPLLSMICDGDQIGIVYPIVNGYALDKQVQRAGPAKLPRMIPQFVKILEAFEFAHSRRCFHLDIKPGNLVFPADAPAQVLDFSMSRMLGISLHTAPLLGSLDYMSPEQLSGGEMDSRADIFSLGAALYHLTTGELPFARGDTVRAAPRPPGLIVPSMPNRLEEVILKALAQAPQERFQTASAFKLALGTCVLGPPVPVPIPVPKRIPAPIPAPPRARALTTESSSFLGWIALAVAIAAGAAATWTAGREYSTEAAPSAARVHEVSEPAPRSAAPKPIVPEPPIQIQPAPQNPAKRQPEFVRPGTKAKPQGPVEVAEIPLPSSAEAPVPPRDVLEIPVTVSAIPPPSEALSQASVSVEPQLVPANPIRITSTAQEAKRLGGRAPVYPTLARDQGITGTVRARITVSAEGRVSAVVPLSGHAFLKHAAVEAIKTWTYSPTIVEGRAVPVVADVNVVFNGRQKSY